MRVGDRRRLLPRRPVFWNIYTIHTQTWKQMLLQERERDRSGANQQRSNKSIEKSIFYLRKRSFHLEP